MVMIFAHTLPQVLDRSKTQTRRIVTQVAPYKGGYAREDILLDESNCHYWASRNQVNKKFPGYGVYIAYHTEGYSLDDGDYWEDHYHVPKYIIGRTYAVQPGRGKPAILRLDGYYWKPTEVINDEWIYSNGFRGAIAMPRNILIESGAEVARIRILRIWQEDVREISAEDVGTGKEGFDTRYLFLDQWVEMHDSKAWWHSDESITVGEWFAFLDTRPAENYQAWALEFEVENDGHGLIEEDFRQGWKDAMTGKTHPIETLWDDILPPEQESER